ncbi:hypothetical protein [uncultured Pedobacter sp.]|uniref:hypothetical protein n=1 Tax=uncultured Pedobacter sp. TaxID=246139 RepID=UPI00262C4063|nr:hypothetical protein [uncultured Pedobacter sp.]
MTELFKDITWSQFLTTVAIIYIIYYLIVGAIYFRKEIRSIFKRRDSEDIYNDLDAPWEDDSPASDLHRDLESTVEDIAHSILVPGKEATKEELLNELKIRVANFGGLSRPGYRYALNNSIIANARKNCGTDFSEVELNEAWDSLSR